MFKAKNGWKNKHLNTLYSFIEILRSEPLFLHFCESKFCIFESKAYVVFTHNHA